MLAAFKDVMSPYVNDRNPPLGPTYQRSIIVFERLILYLFFVRLVQSLPNVMAFRTFFFGARRSDCQCCSKSGHHCWSPCTQEYQNIKTVYKIFYSWLWFTRRQVSESIIQFPRLKPLAGLEQPFVKSQLLSTVDVSDPSPFRGSGHPKSSIRREQSFGFTTVGIVGIISGRPV